MTALGDHRLGTVAQRRRAWPGSVGPGTRLPVPPATHRPRASTSRRARLEAVLFVAREPLTLRRLAQLANLQDATEARTLLGELQQVYDLRGCSFQVQALAGGHQLLTREKLAPWLRAANSREPGLRLSGPSMETLAVVAYRQPVLRAEVEAIRGVQCGELLRQLMERDLLRIVGRSDELGRPILYGTTQRFLRFMGVRSLDELPRYADLKPGGFAKQSEADEDSVTTLLAEG